jgi:hypothetical protein
MRLQPQTDVGTMVTLKLNLPNTKQNLKVGGVVSRTGAGRQAAVRFAQLTPVLMDSLEDFIGGDPQKPIESSWFNV